MQNLASNIIRLFFIGSIVAGSVVFNSFLNWYDTGQFSRDGWYLLAGGGLLLGWLAFILERRLYNRYGFWPQNKILFFGRMIIFSIVYLALNFAVSSGVRYTIGEIFAGGEIRESLQMLLIVPVVTIFYTLMILPFGLVVGIINGALLMVNYQFFTHNPA